MNYEDLLKAQLKYGTTKEDIMKKRGFEDVLENVVIAPWWEHTMFDVMNYKVEKVSDYVYNLYGDNISFSFIEIKRIGAPGITDFFLSLGVTKCKNIVFVGSAGSLDENIKIGDIVIPEYSICGDGASRYLNKNLEDELFKKEYPSKEYTEKLISILKEEKINYHYVPNFSVDSIFTQFYHLDKILNLGSKVIEMETANLFKCNEVLKRNITALFVISDNTVVNKSIYSGRSDEEEIYRHKVRNEIVPKIIVKLFERD